MLLPQQCLGYEAFALRLSLLGMPFPISVTQPGIHFLPWHWVLWMQINLKILFAFVRQFFPENESSILLSCLYLWEVGSSISMAV